jgi:ankyrin repeat protein
MGSLRSLRSQAESAKVGLVTDAELIEAIQSGTIRQVETLLKQGANPYAEGWFGSNALQHALYKDDLRMAELLVRYMPDVNQRDSHGRTPLHQAIFVLSCVVGATCVFLLELGADINAAHLYGYTPLMEAVDAKRYDIARLLLQSGADATVTNSDGFRAVDLLSPAKGGKALRKLLEKVS